MVFLAAPTVVTLVNKNADVSLCYSFSEEEQVHKQITFPSEMLPTPTPYILERQQHSFPFENLLHDSLSRNIFIPPPNLI